MRKYLVTKVLAEGRGGVTYAVTMWQRIEAEKPVDDLRAAVTVACSSRDWWTPEDLHQELHKIDSVAMVEVLDCRGNGTISKKETGNA